MRARITAHLVRAQMTQKMANVTALPWLNRPRYYTQVTSDAADPVTVFEIPDNVEVSSEQPGTPVLHLEPGSQFVRVRDADAEERGVICSEGIFPRTRYVMRRDGETVWVLSLRSLVLKRHLLTHG